ncbi:MAG TPA: hypothetical protein VJQ82_12685 [Terriglobales bacterium]|nr:hypothetical protein [Terriglobales bacterium]
MNQKHIRWTAVVLLGIVSLATYRPRLHHTGIRLFGFESFAVAESLVEHRGFSDPFMPLATGPSAHLPPLFPAYLALVISLFGSGPVGANIIVWTPVVLLILQLMLLPLLAERLGVGFWTGCLAVLAWVAAGVPPSYTSESDYAALLIVGISFFMARSFTGVLSRGQVLLCAALWGTLLLVQPVAVAVLAGWLVLLGFQRQGTRGQIVALGLLPIVIVAPWMVRNFLVFHRPVFVRDNLGLELAVSNNSCASALFEDNDRSRCFDATHPNRNLEEAAKVRQMGEVEYNRLKLKEAIHWISSHPQEFAVLTAQRFRAFWLTPRSENNGNGMIWRPMVMQLFTLLSIPGLFFMWKTFRPGAYVVALWLVFFPPIYYVVQFMDRYRYPIFWATLLAGSYFIMEMVGGLVGFPLSSSPVQQPE